MAREQSKKTSLTKVEVARRALDAPAEAEEAKEQRRFLTPKQRRDIKQLAHAKGLLKPKSPSKLPIAISEECPELPEKNRKK